MATEEKSNRSSAFTTEQLGEINVAMSLAIKDAVAGAVAAAMAGLAPILKEVALTPEKLREINKPYVDPAKIARNERETELWREDIEAQRAQMQATQDNCLHTYDNGLTSIQLEHNFPDRQPRGLCVQCHALIYPREWRIGAPTKANPRGTPYLFGPHKDYGKVMQLAAKKG